MIKIVAVAAVTFALATAGCAARESSGAVARTAWCDRQSATFTTCRAQFQPDRLSPSTVEAALPEDHSTLAVATHERGTHVTTEAATSTFRATTVRAPSMNPRHPL
jgi:hypothetical protein